MPFLGKTPAQIVDPEVDIDGGSIDGATIGATSASAATVTTFTSTGIDDNATSTAITIDSSQDVSFTGSVACEGLTAGDTSSSFSGVYIISSTTGESELRMGDTDSDAGSIAYTNSNDTMTFRTGAGPRMTIDASGNVGIGTNNPDAPLTITEASNVAINILKSSGNSLLKIGEDGSNHAVYNALYNEHIFQANGSERMRIDNSGNLLVGKTSVSGNQGHTLYSSGLYYIHIDGTGSSETVRFYRNGGAIKAGWITTSGTGTTYNSLSDLRLKENITDAPAGNIDNIRVRSFDWKLTGEHQTYGMVAQELVEVAPEAVSQGDTDDDMWGVDYSKLVPMMIKEIQDLKAEVAALKGAN